MSRLQGVQKGNSPAQPAKRSYELDITWLKDDSLEWSDDLSEPQDLATEAITEQEAIFGDLREIVALTQSLLAKAFRGELVPTEHALAERKGREYETAEQLLVRIRAAKSDERPASKKKSGRSKAGPK